MKYNYGEIGRRFRNERKRNFISQEKFAGRMRDGLWKEDKKTGEVEWIREPCGISRNTLSALENGDIPEGLTLKQFLTMCEILRCDAAYLLGECDCKKREIADIQKETGLSEGAIINLQLRQKTNIPLFTQYSRFYSEFICNAGMNGILISAIPGYFKIKKEGLKADSDFTNKEEALSYYEFLIVKAIMRFLSIFFENEEIEEIILDVE